MKKLFTGHEQKYIQGRREKQIKNKSGSFLIWNNKNVEEVHIEVSTSASGGRRFLAQKNLIKNTSLIEDVKIHKYLFGEAKKLAKHM